MSGNKPTALARSLGRVQIAGFLVIGLLVLAIGGWAAGTEIAGAVIASGQISVRSNAKPVSSSCRKHGPAVLYASALW